MKYKLLVAGSAASVIDDFFLKMTDSFEIMTTSMRHEDILLHIKYFKPHMFVFCLYNESRDDFNKMISLKYQMTRSRVYFALIGSQADCSDFERIAINVSDITLVKPLTVGAIETRIMGYLSSHHPLDMSAPDPDDGFSGGFADSFSSGFSGGFADSFSGGFSGDMLNPFQDAAGASFSFDDLDIPAPKPTRKHVLVVDDDIRMLKVLKEHLHDDFDVATAVSGKVAMKFLEKKHTDLILLDYEMPEEKGPDVLARIRANENTKSVPVIFLTGTTERDKIAKALAHKPQGYLLKPIDREKLLETITKVMGE